jgi:hypothetical protein
VRKPQLPADDAVTALARRLDDVDTRLLQLDALTRDVAAVGRGLADLTAQVRALTEATNRGIVTAPNRKPLPAGSDDTTAASGGDDGATEGMVQPNWLTVTDPDLAAAWLAAAMTFAAEVLARFPDGSVPDCWPLHEAAVVEMVALQSQYATAYEAEHPGPVSELLGRWLPGAVRRLTKATAECERRSGHVEGRHVYQVPHLDAGRVAVWWVESRGTDPTASVAFAMTAVT